MKNNSEITIDELREPGSPENTAPNGGPRDKDKNGTPPEDDDEPDHDFENNYGDLEGSHEDKDIIPHIDQEPDILP